VQQRLPAFNELFALFYINLDVSRWKQHQSRKLAYFSSLQTHDFIVYCRCDKQKGIPAYLPIYGISAKEWE